MTIFFLDFNLLFGFATIILVACIVKYIRSFNYHFNH